VGGLGEERAKQERCRTTFTVKLIACAFWARTNAVEGGNSPGSRCQRIAPERSHHSLNRPTEVIFTHDVATGNAVGHLAASTSALRWKSFGSCSPLEL